MNKRKRIIILVTSMIIGCAIFAVAYPIVANPGAKKSDSKNAANASDTTRKYSPPAAGY